MAGDYWIRYEEPEKTKKLLIELKNGRLVSFCSRREPTSLSHSRPCPHCRTSIRVCAGHAWGDRDDHWRAVDGPDMARTIKERQYLTPRTPGLVKFGRATRFIGRSSTPALHEIGFGYCFAVPVAACRLSPQNTPNHPAARRPKKQKQEAEATHNRCTTQAAVQAQQIWRNSETGKLLASKTQVPQCSSSVSRAARRPT